MPNNNLDIDVKLNIRESDPTISYILETQKQNIEIFAAAYLEQTKIPPDKAVLVQQVDGNIIRWWFEEKRSD